MKQKNGAIGLIPTYMQKNSSPKKGSQIFHSFIRNLHNVKKGKREIPKRDKTEEKYPELIQFG